MQLTINGEACTCAEGLTVPAADFAATALNEGDVLEIVQFVGGG